MNSSLARLTRRFARLAAACFATASALAVCSQVQAAELQAGTWSGTVTPPSGEAAPATFTVGEADGQTKISVAVSGLMLDFRDIEVADDAIMFVWSPGPEVSCHLNLQDDATYAGECTDENGGTGYITMVPPD